LKAILTNGYGGTDVLYLGEHPEPVPKENEVKVRIKATALNRADLLQRQGLYPPPPGATSIIGLEMAGVIEEVGSQVQNWKIGDRVFSLLPGGGYAEKVTVPADLLMPTPVELSDVEGAAIAETYLTAYLNLVWIGGLTNEKTVLVHAGASGVGTSAIQLIKQMGARSIVTVRSREKAEFCRSLGADVVLIGKEGFSEEILNLTDNHGVDLILDCVGASYWQDNLKSISMGGKLIVIGVMGGGNVENVPLMELIKRRISIVGSSLRSQPEEEKINLSQEFARTMLPHFKTGNLRTVVDRVFNWEDVQEAHTYMERNENIGKIILKVFS